MNFAFDLPQTDPAERGPPDMGAVFVLTVYGTPAPAGSKKAVPLGGKFGGRAIVVDASKKSAPWKEEIRQAAGKHMQGHELLDGPLVLKLTFYVRRPKGHHGARGGVRPSAPVFPAVKPDVLKLARAVEDALSGITYRDDAQIVSELLEKRYDTPERVEIRIWRAT